MSRIWRKVICGQSNGGRRASPSALALDLHGSSPTVHLKISDLRRSMAQDIPDILVDLVEIATYVFAADQSLGRGSAVDTGGRWRRRMEFRIPVRLPELWSRPEVLDALVDTLSFLTDDDYRFQFTSQRKPAPVQRYLELADSDPEDRIDQVQLFSGGVDSLAGAIQAAIREKKNIVLVSHRSGAKRVPMADALFERLKERSTGRIHRVAVWATTAGGTSREYTQRSRSFLYASLAATVASLLGLDSFSFYENGVTSVNLPLAGQVVGARATRTTHPQTLRGFERLLGAVLGKPFTVRLPFLWRTKGEVMQLVAEHDSDLLPLSVSCSRTIAATIEHPHCGTCSQCLDRRFAALALRLGDDADPRGEYKVDLLTGERAPGEDRTMAEAFVQRARSIRSASDEEFFRLFPEATRILKHTGLATNDAATRLLALQRRHGEEVHRALADGIRTYAEDFESGRLPDSCLLALTLPDKYKQRQTAGEQDSGVKGPSLVCEGASWRFWFDNETLTMKESQGLRYLAYLLQHPGRQFSCLELSTLDAGAAPPLSSTSGGCLSDRASIREYRDLVAKLGTAISEAEAHGDPERALILREERREIRAHLSRVTGLGGRPRRESDAADRARKAVGIALARVLSEIEQRKHLALRRHLGTCLTRGYGCAYRPVPPVSWHVQTTLSQ